MLFIKSNLRRTRIQLSSYYSMVKRPQIYFDHQATTQMFPIVFKEMQDFSKKFYANPHSSDHVLGWEMGQTIQKCREILSKFAGCDEDELIFTSGATEANNHAILGVGRSSYSPTRNRILISSVEHSCVMAACYVLSQRYGMTVERVPVDASGAVDLSALSGMMDHDVRLVSIMAVNNEIGTLQDLKAVGRVIHQHGSLFHCDASQAPIAMRFSEIIKSADLISFSAHKMYGPKGVGALVIRREHHGRVEPLIYGGGQQNGLRAGTLPTPLCVGFAAAATEMATELSKERFQEVRRLRNIFVKEFLKVVPGSKLNGPDLEKRHPGNANFYLGNLDGADFLNRLQPLIAASTGSACSSGTIEPSYVLRAIGLSEDQARSSVRFSLGIGSTAEEVEAAISAVQNSVINWST